MQRRRRIGNRVWIVGLIAALALGIGIGFKASDIIIGSQFVVKNQFGKKVAVLGHDGTGNGLLVFFDDEGNELTRFDGSSAPSQTPPPSPPPDPGDLVMMVERIEPLEPDISLLRDAEELEALARSLARQVVGTKASIASNQDKSDNDDFDRGAKIRHLQEELARLNRELRAARGQAAALRREYDEPRHRIIGWDGEREVTLETTRDMTPILSRVSPGDFLSWRGRQVYMTRDESEWDAHVVKVVSEPAGFGKR